MLCRIDRRHDLFVAWSCLTLRQWHKIIPSATTPSQPHPDTDGSHAAPAHARWSPQSTPHRQIVRQRPRRRRRRRPPCPASPPSCARASVTAPAGQIHIPGPLLTEAHPPKSSFRPKLLTVSSWAAQWRNPLLCRCLPPTITTTPSPTRSNPFFCDTLTLRIQPTEALT